MKSDRWVSEEESGRFDLIESGYVPPVPPDDDNTLLNLLVDDNDREDVPSFRAWADEQDLGDLTVHLQEAAVSYSGSDDGPRAATDRERRLIESSRAQCRARRCDHFACQDLYE